MNDTEPAAGPASRAETPSVPQSAGEKLRAAREAQGLTLADIAARTRVPIRHLEAIESGDYREMPTPTYAVGFAKAYARAVDEDEAAIGRDVRMRTASISAERQDYKPYELDDPARVPPRGLALIAAGLAVIVLLAALAWFGTSWFAGGSASDSTSTETAATAGPTPAAPPLVSQTIPAAQTQVMLTALDRVWVRVADSAGKTMFQATMNPGDTYQVPTTAAGPRLTVGRPDQLRVSIDGKALPPLGSGARPMKDVPIDAPSLSARASAAAATAAPATATTATPTPQSTAAPPSSATPTPTSRATKRTSARASAKPSPSPKASPRASQALPPPTGIY